MEGLQILMKKILFTLNFSETDYDLSVFSTKTVTTKNTRIRLI